MDIMSSASLASRYIWREEQGDQGQLERIARVLFCSDEALDDWLPAVTGSTAPDSSGATTEDPTMPAAVPRTGAAGQWPPPQTGRTRPRSAASAPRGWLPGWSCLPARRPRPARTAP